MSGSANKRSRVRLLLWPVSLVWGAVVRLRVLAYRWGLRTPKRLPGVVISVGNLTAGGTGKTPMVIWIAERMRSHLPESNKRIGILTRGYRGSRTGASGEPQSDEVAILRARLPHHAELGVGPNRCANGQILARHGVEWFILDDGFQHMQLARDINIVLIDATDPFGGGHLLPVGLLREPKSALARADIVVITRSQQALGVETILRRYTTAPIFYAVTEMLDVLPLPGQSEPEIPMNWREEKVFAFCAIGNADAFFNDLARWGFHVAGHAGFPDHHKYSQAEVSQLMEQAKKCGATALICTEKDVFNLRGVSCSGLPVGFARIAMRMTALDAFWAAVQSIVKSKRGNTTVL
ncbi:MAG TPA: tetraacyldisaccharide 4'-kinase [Candidatus Acidoferrum sp.]|nr:tetraacyldisaccharide 4'-kinase [Candidatus Acidoferrum sp.]